MAGIKITRIDYWFSRCVRERANWTCERCNRVFPDGQASGKAQGLDCSHYFGRGSGNLMRHYGANCFAHCRGCHQYLSANPHEFTYWVKGRLGDVCYDELVARKGRTCKRSAQEKKEMQAHFKAQYEYLRRRRKEKGEAGYIDFVEWD